MPAQRGDTDSRERNGAARTRRLRRPDDQAGASPETLHRQTDLYDTRAEVDVLPPRRDREGRHVESATIVGRPYQQRRAYAICKKVWPELDILCTSRRQSLPEYIATIGDRDKVINMLVGDTQRIWVYAQRGCSATQSIPLCVKSSYEFLGARGFTNRTIR